MRRRRYKLLIIILVLLVAAGGGYYAFTVYNSTVTELHNKTIEQEEEIEYLHSDIDYYRSLFTKAYCLTADVKAGNPITDDMIEEKDISYSSLPLDAILEKENIVGRLVKIDCSAGTPVSNNLLSSYTLTDDDRELDVVFDEIPIALEEGDYVDVRISFPLGQDFIAMSHKRVIGVYDNVLKIIVNQEDIYTYESMKTDKSTYVATKVYCVKYVEPGVQLAALVYYPTSLEIMDTKLRDTNIDTSDYTEELESRQILEEQLNTSDKVEKRKTVTTDKTALTNEFESAKKEYDRLQEKKAAEAAREAAKNN